MVDLAHELIANPCDASEDVGLWEFCFGAYNDDCLYVWATGRRSDVMDGLEEALDAMDDEMRARHVVNEEEIVDAYKADTGAEPADDIEAYSDYASDYADHLGDGTWVSKDWTVRDVTDDDEFLDVLRLSRTQCRMAEIVGTDDDEEEGIAFAGAGVGSTDDDRFRIFEKSGRYGFDRMAFTLLDTQRRIVGGDPTYVYVRFSHAGTSSARNNPIDENEYFEMSEDDFEEFGNEINGTVLSEHAYRFARDWMRAAGATEHEVERTIGYRPPGDYSASGPGEGIYFSGVDDDMVVEWINGWLSIDGFHTVDTGGGCSAFIYNLPHYHILVTNNDCGLPEESEPVVIGIYAGGDEDPDTVYGDEEAGEQAMLVPEHFSSPKAQTDEIARVIERLLDEYESRQPGAGIIFHGSRRRGTR